MAELQIPDKTLELFFHIADAGMYEHDDPAREDLRALAGPIVAAELRRLAGPGGLDPSTEGHFRSAANILTARADELDDGSSS